MFGKTERITCFIILLIWVMSLSGCATMEEDQVQSLEQQPVISNTIAERDPSAPKGLKRKVAIARFSNETRYGQSFFLDENDDRIGKQAVDILSAKLLETEKFIVLERVDLDKIQRELSIGNSAEFRNMAETPRFSTF